MEEIDTRDVLDLVPELSDVPYLRIWTAYDKEAEGLLKEISH